MKKQSVLLGLRDKLEKGFANMLTDMFSKFTNKQGIFMGWNRTYTPLEGFADDPTKRSFQKVSGTVKEQLIWFKDHTEDYLTTVLSIEKTNSSGIKAKLVVDGKEWGEYSVLELLRLKSIMDGKIKGMIDQLPIRDEKVHWVPTTNTDLYDGKAVYETPLTRGFSKTTLKRMEIVNDPHIKEAPNRAPVPVQIETQVNVGEYTDQRYTGEITNLERAQMQVRFDKLYVGVIEALENSNNVDSIESDLGKKFLDYMF